MEKTRMWAKARQVYPTSAPGYVHDIERNQSIFVKGMAAEYINTSNIKNQLTQKLIAALERGEKEKAEGIKEAISLFE